MMMPLLCNYRTCEARVISNNAFDWLSLLLYRFTLTLVAIVFQLTSVLIEPAQVL
jgi:hypothetical protein